MPSLLEGVRKRAVWISHFENSSGYFFLCVYILVVNANMSQAKGPDIDRLYKLAANKQRWAVINTLLQTSGEIHLDELVSRIETDQSESTESGAPDQERKPVEIELIHQHLPMLHEAGFIDFDRGRMIISTRNRLKQFEKIFPDSYE